MAGLLVSGCSFNLPARACDSPGCATSDMGSTADMTPAFPDPNLAGPYKVATAPVTLGPTQPSLHSGQLYLPSDDGATLSTKLNTYPLVLMAPAFHMDQSQLVDYGQRLASHGFVVALYQVETESDQFSYRSVGINLVGSFLANQEPVIANHIDAAHVGLAGYDLGGEMSVAIVTQDQAPAFRGLALIDPQVVSTFPNQIDGLAEMAKVKLTGGQPVLILGEDKSNTSTTGMLPCTTATTNYLPFYNASTTPTIALYFANAAHGEFTDTYPDPSCIVGAMAQVDTKRLALKYLTAYFQWTLQERTQAQDYLTGASFMTDATKYMLTLTQK